MSNSKFAIGQRAFVSSLNPNHSITKRQVFLGRVVTVINVSEQKNGFRYFIQLATDKRFTMFILERHLEHLSDQELHPRDRANLRVKHANEIPLFDKKRLPLPDQEQMLWDAYMILDHGGYDERLSMLEKLENYFERVGKPTKDN
ncbi:hypothetical protein [Vibrio sp. TRT 29B02]|uniref:hypothetical protein n=1 Tax=Vibrio sp. TRT 29B02 TaxID=3418508 RepID=UPI003CE95930